LPLTPEALENRLIDFAAIVILETRRLPRDLATVHVAKQLIRSVTAPAANYAEARSAESPRDFVHKMQIGLKELRETSVWLRLLSRLRGVRRAPPTAECDELISIFVRSIQTARRRVEGEA
jgi:four helix bundle protein